MSCGLQHDISPSDLQHNISPSDLQHDISPSDLQHDISPSGGWGLGFCGFKNRKVSLDDHDFVFALDFYDSVL